MLLLEEHFLEYAGLVQQQVTAQLACVREGQPQPASGRCVASPATTSDASEAASDDLVSTAGSR